MNLKIIRKQKGLTQEELADRSGVDQTTISNIEVGRVRNPSWVIVSRLADALEVDPKELFPVEASTDAA